MRVIHKLQINIRTGNEIKLLLPIHSTIMSVDFQGEKLVVWYMFDPINEYTLSSRDLYILRTGEAAPNIIDSDKSRFIGTAYDRDEVNPFVIHVFETTRPI